MQGWLKSFHGANQAFPAMRVAVKAAVALALGLLVGFEREWSNKDRGGISTKACIGAGVEPQSFIPSLRILHATEGSANPALRAFNSP
jgi:uncharacterized membrane protein YhiD involved in acid resistance